MLLLKDIMLKLIYEEPLDSKHKDHKLTGNYRSHRECHIEPDWLLIYRITTKDIFFERLGTHSDLFKK
ncbi:MAG: type II toxin-antitoxin system YafQ family toxin [Chlamydiota bacterium]